MRWGIQAVVQFRAMLPVMALVWFTVLHLTDAGFVYRLNMGISAVIAQGGPMFCAGKSFVTITAVQKPYHFRGLWLRGGSNVSQAYFRGE